MGKSRLWVLLAAPKETFIRRSFLIRIFDRAQARNVDSVARH